MSTYMVEYSTDNGATLEMMLVSAKDYTEAYTNAVFALPFGVIIAEVFKL